MIIQCPKCLAKFKLDDTKIKDEGTKVRCAKCKEVFVVTKEAPALTSLPAPEPEAPVDKGEFDFSFGSSPGEEEKEEVSSPFGGGFGEESPKEEASGKEADFSFGEMPAEETKETKEEAGLDWGGMSYGEVSISESEAAKAEPEVAFGSFDYKAEEPAFGDVKFKEEEPHFEPPHEEALSSPKPPAPTILPVEEKAPVKEEARIQERFVEKGPRSGFETEAVPGGEFAEEFPEEFPGEVKTEERQSFLRLGALVVLIAAIIAVPVWYWMNYKKTEPGEISLADLNGGYARNAEAGNVFVITGRAVNNTNKARSFLLVKGTLFNKKGEKLAQKETYCGNVFTQKEINTLPRAKIEADLKNKVGGSLSNINIAPGKSVFFTIAFFDLPKDTSEFSVEVTGSQLASE